MNSLYRKLAFTNIKNSRQFYLPYLLTGILSSMMFYSMRAIQGNEGILNMPGGAVLRTILTMGTVVIGIFVCIFLFYTNSFIMKRRKKELGVYNILGMEKKHIVKVMFWETLFTFLVSVGGGLFFGILFNKLLTMFLYRLTGLEESIPFYISGQGCLQTVELFGGIYLATLAYNFMQIQIANPIELLRGGNTGEKEPKTKVLLAIIGVLCIGSGYYIAITTENPIKAIMLFFVAVLLVIIGTYCLFTAGSIAFLKLLRKNKKYYYQTKHFTTVSGMIYRMKQNAVGLANICILSTMVLVMLSTTVSMYLGLESELNDLYENEITTHLYFNEIPSDETMDTYREEVKSSLKDSGRMISNETEFLYMNMTALREENEIKYFKYEVEYDLDEVTAVKVMTMENYERYTGQNYGELQAGEVAIAANPGFEDDTIIFNGKEYRVAKTVEFPEEDAYYAMIGGGMYFIVKDNNALQEVLQQTNEVRAASGNDSSAQVDYQIGIDIGGTPEEKLASVATVRDFVNRVQNVDVVENGQRYDNAYVESRQEGLDDFVMSNGGFFFLGLFLGVMFLMVTVLIIYYKQISEGYDDKERYAIMEKVGMSNREVKAAISSQIRTVFFLPLVTAAIHLAAAFPMLKRLLALLNLMNGTLFFWCLIGTVLLFGVIYLIVFMLTSRSYYKIVGNQV